MSMSQEEIEALMNGLDISESENSESDDSSSEEKDSENMSENDIADLIAQTDLSNASVEDEPAADTPPTEEVEVSENVSNSDIDELLNAMEEDTSLEDSESKETESSEEVSDSDIDELLNSVEEEPAVAEKETENEEVSNSDIDDLLNNIEEETSDTSSETVDNSSVSSDEVDSIINGIMAENSDVDEAEDVDTSEIDDLIAGLETTKESEDDDYLSGLDFNSDASSIDDIDKVAEKKEEVTVSSNKKSNDVVNVDKINIPNQLGEVANDSEEKATKIFDALSYILDDNEELRKTTKTLDEFMQSQLKMLQMLNKKFPNVKEFSDNLETINRLIDKPKEIQTRLHNRDKELFDTMELMQFHDINRQKIERVMGLVINLSRQLNSIFDDESNSGVNLPGANHLPGDNSDDLVDGEDLESLIAEFGK